VTPVVKRCSGCGINRPARDFHISRTSSTGLQSYCKACTTDRDRKRRLAKRDPNAVLWLTYKVRLKQCGLRLCSLCHTEKKDTEFHKSKTRCKPCSALLAKEAHKRNREKNNAYCRSWYRKNLHLVMLRHIREADRKRGHRGDLTLDDVIRLTSFPCHYCGVTEKIGLDRIDNSLGHSKENVLPCCSLCNRTRMANYTVDEMLILGRAVAQIRSNRLGVLCAAL
jgi:hypothetical protein